MFYDSLLQTSGIKINPVPLSNIAIFSIGNYSAQKGWQTSKLCASFLGTDGKNSYHVDIMNKTILADMLKFSGNLIGLSVTVPSILDVLIGMSIQTTQLYGLSNQYIYILSHGKTINATTFVLSLKKKKQKNKENQENKETQEILISRVKAHALDLIKWYHDYNINATLFAAYALQNYKPEFSKYYFKGDFRRDLLELTAFFLYMIDPMKVNIYMRSADPNIMYYQGFDLYDAISYIYMPIDTAQLEIESKDSNYYFKLNIFPFKQYENKTGLAANKQAAQPIYSFYSMAFRQKNLIENRHNIQNYIITDNTQKYIKRFYIDIYTKNPFSKDLIELITNKKQIKDTNPFKFLISCIIETDNDSFSKKFVSFTIYDLLYAKSRDQQYNQTIYNIASNLVNSIKNILNKQNLQKIVNKDIGSRIASEVQSGISSIKNNVQYYLDYVPYFRGIGQGHLQSPYPKYQSQTASVSADLNPSKNFQSSVYYVMLNKYLAIFSGTRQRPIIPYIIFGGQLYIYYGAHRIVSRTPGLSLMVYKHLLFDSSLYDYRDVKEKPYLQDLLNDIYEYKFPGNMYQQNPGLLHEIILTASGGKIFDYYLNFIKAVIDTKIKNREQRKSITKEQERKEILNAFINYVAKPMDQDLEKVLKLTAQYDWL